MRVATQVGWLSKAGFLLLALLMAGSCTTEKIVTVEREPFNPPPDAASGLLGYFQVTSKQTTCGNCHAGHQGTWVASRHARAYSTLAGQNATGNQTCVGCHTVNANGNDLTGSAGFMVKADSAYRDVQCESCHGPGLTHVTGVLSGQVSRPLAKMSMTGDGNCGECHSGAHHPFADEWRNSGHANVRTSPASNTASGCANCHDGRQALVAWGKQTNFKEKAQSDAYQPTTCVVCHDPHGSNNPSSLRWPITTPDPDRNLCMKCHNRRNEPTSTQSSPHAPQGSVLLGTAGYKPVGFTYAENRILGSHSSEANPKLCAGCHVTRLEVRDKISNQFLFQATGHLMRPIPCLDANGQPTADKNCAYNSTARSWKSCTAAGCHGSAAVAASVFNTVRLRMKTLVDVLWIDSNGNGSMQAAPTDAGYLPTVRQMRPTEWSSTDNRISPAEGAEFNARMCGEYGQSTADNSKGIHNPFLCEALLIATIAEVRATYGLAAPPQAVLDIMNGPVGGPFASSMRVTNE